MIIKETSVNEKWIPFKDQLDDILGLKGSFYSGPHSKLSVGEVHVFGNRIHFCLEPYTPSLFLSYPLDQLNHKESRLISLAIKREWERRIGFSDRSKDAVLHKILLGIYREQDLKQLNRLSLFEKESYLPMSVRFRNHLSMDELIWVEEGLSTYFGVPVSLIHSGEHYFCLLPIDQIPVEEEMDAIHWNDLGQNVLELLEAELNLETRIAFSSPVQGIPSWGPGLRSASRTLQVGLQIYPENRIFFSWELSIELFLHLIPKEMVQPFLDSVWGDWGKDNLTQEWVKIVRTLIQENLNISETARKMYVHRNTLMYRMEKFKIETGRDLRMIEDVIQVYLAMLLTRLGKYGAQK